MIGLLGGGGMLTLLALWPLRRALGARTRSAQGLMVALPLAAFALYAVVGAPEAAKPTPRQLLRQQAETLAARLAGAPGAPADWVALARTQRLLGRNDEAAAAFAHAGRYLDTRPQWLVEYAEVCAAQQGNFLGAPTRLLEKALSHAPRHVPALLLAGRAAYERGDVRGAVGYWSRARSELPPSSPQYAELGARIADAATSEVD